MLGGLQERVGGEGTVEMSDKRVGCLCVLPGMKEEMNGEF